MKEAVGALTDDQRLKDEGRLDQITRKIKQGVERVIDKAKNAVKRPVPGSVAPVCRVTKASGRQRDAGKQQ